MAKKKGIGSRFGHVNAPTLKSNSATKKKVAPAAAKKPKAPKAPKPAKKLTAAERKLKAERDKVTAAKRAEKKSPSKSKPKGTLAQRLKKRQSAFTQRLRKLAKAHKTRRQNLRKRQTVVRKNLTAKQNTARANLKGRLQLRLKNSMKAKPMIKGDKIVSPAKGTAKFKAAKPKLTKLPSARTGIVKKKKKGTAAQRAGAKKAAKTTKRNAGRAKVA